MPQQSFCSTRCTYCNPPLTRATFPSPLFHSLSLSLPPLAFVHRPLPQVCLLKRMCSAGQTSKKLLPASQPCAAPTQYIARCVLSDAATCDLANLSHLGSCEARTIRKKIMLSPRPLRFVLMVTSCRVSLRDVYSDGHSIRTCFEKVTKCSFCIRLYSFS